MTLKSPSSVLRTLAWIPVVAGLGMTQSANALIFIASGDIGFNSTAPTGPLEGSGWQYQGSWQGLLATAVSPNFFLTAKHIGGGVGGTFTYHGNSYTTSARIDHPTADLTLWQVSGTLPSYAPIYTGNSEIGQDVVLFGRSPVRGAEVNVSGASPTPLRGWLWGSAGGGITRWGENQVDGIEVLSGAQYLVAGFSFNGGPNEAMLASGDSGGGLFIQDGGIWKLAGINSKVQATFAASAAGPTFEAAIFDAGGLFTSTTGGLLQLPDTAEDWEALFLSTRISAYSGWVQKWTAVPEPATVAAWAGAGLIAFAGVRRWRRGV
jgi:hypothetical protein